MERRQKLKAEESYSSYVSNMNETQLKTYIHTVGKAANQRLRELEKQGLERTSAAYRYIEKLGFDKDYATSVTGAGQLKFNLRVRGRSINELRHMVSTIDKFMDAKSSTTGGVKSIYADAYKTFEKNFGNKMNFNEFAESMSYTLLRHFERIYGSTTAIYIIEKGHAGGLSDFEITQALEQAGFTLSSTKEDAPTLGAIVSSLESFIANKKGFENDGKGIFDAGEDL